MKCACSRRTVYGDFECRAGWQPVLQSVLGHESLLLKVVNKYEPSYNVNNNSITDGDDIAILAQHFGEADP